jgi:hypothetical protein
LRLEVCIPEFKGASVVAVKRVNELDFYSLGAKEFAEKLDRSVPKAVAMVDYLKIRLQPDCYKEFKIGPAQALFVQGAGDNQGGSANRECAGDLEPAEDRKLHGRDQNEMVRKFPLKD